MNTAGLPSSRKYTTPTPRKRTLASYTYSGNNGHLEQMTYGNGAYIQYSYDLFDRVIRQTYNDGTTYGYRYNANGDLASQYELDADGGTVRSYAFEYDSLDRLIRSRETDAAGNLVQRTEHIYDNANRLTSQSYQIPGTGTHKETYAYDSTDGKLTKQSYVFSTGGTASITLSYDALKRLETETAKKGSATVYTKTYDYRDSTATENRTTLQVTDIGITDKNGDAVLNRHYNYNAYADITSVTDGTNTPTELGFYYLQSRYYDPSVGRFVNADSAEYSTMAAYGLDDTNLFTYCRNNPVAAVDKGGEWIHLAVGAVVGGIIGGVTAAIGGGSTAEIVTGVLTGAASGALTASGIGLLGSIIGNAAISLAGNVANQVIENKGFSNFDVKSMAFDTALGAVGGAIGGKGASYGNARSAMSMGKQFVRRVSKTGEFKKALVYHGKSMKNGAGKSIFKEITKSFVKSESCTIVSAGIKSLCGRCVK